MCRMVFIADGPACETQGELRAEMGGLIYYESVPLGAMKDSECLCWVDVPAMAKRDGYTVEDAGDWTLTKSAT